MRSRGYGGSSSPFVACCARLLRPIFLHLDSHLNSLDRRQNQLVAELNSLDRRQNQLVAEFNSLDRRQNQFVAEFNSLDRRQNQLVAEFNSLDRRQNQLVAEFNSLDRRQNQFVAELNSLDRRQNQLDRDLKAVVAMGWDYVAMVRRLAALEEHVEALMQRDVKAESDNSSQMAIEASILKLEESGAGGCEHTRDLDCAC